MAGVHQQPDQSNYLAEGQTCKLVALVVCQHNICLQWGVHPSPYTLRETIKYIPL